MSVSLSIIIKTDFRMRHDKDATLKKLEETAAILNKAEGVDSYFVDTDNMKVAVYWYERAIELDNDLARSNLADILRKGSKGYPKDLKRAFELYKSCGLPYAHYRCGEFYENGWGVEKDLGKAKTYYMLAYNEGHGLAKRKRQEWDFMK